MEEKITISLEDYNNLKRKETVLTFLWEANEKSRNPMELIKCSFPDCKSMAIRDDYGNLEVFHRCTDMHECSSKYEIPDIEKECEVCYCDKHVAEFGDSHSYNLGVSKCYVCRDCVHLYQPNSLPI